MNEVLSRRVARYLEQADLSPHDPNRNESFAALPDLILIDGGKGQLSAGMKALQPLVERGVTVISLAKRIEEIFVPGRSAPVMLDERSAGLRLLQRVRDEAHRFAITFHRTSRDKSMTALGPGRGQGRRAGSQAGAAEALRVARPARRGDPRGAGGRPGGPG